jgi:small subunit ribosomal protein S4
MRLQEKQKAKRIYAVSERQFENYFTKAETSKGVTGSNLLMFLERRLDNVVYRLGFGASRAAARQLVLHGHLLVNGKKVNISSYQIRANEVISVRDKSKPQIKKLLEVSGEKKPPEWLSLDAEKLEGKVERIPQREDIDTLIEEQMIVEYYAR